jgi:Flp pilus assembly protein TadG
MRLLPKIHLPGLRSRRVAPHDEGGQALVEFALVLPVLLLVLFGIVQFALALNSQNDQTHVANEIARYAIVDENPGTEEAKTLAEWGKKQLYTNYTSALNSEGKVCISFPSGTEVGSPVKVEVTSTTNWLPILKLPATSTEIKGVAYMRLEATPNPSIYKAECA